MLTTLDDFKKAFTEIKNRGWIKTHRSGNTGIGKTLEDLLGIAENNFSTSDFGVYELKAQREDATSMLTLFTKSPEPQGINSRLREEFGYSSDAYANEEKVLHVTLAALRPVSVANTGHTLKLDFCENMLRLLSETGDTGAYWPMETIRQKISEKYQGQLVYVTAQSRGAGVNEEFLFSKAIAVSNITFESVMAMLKQDKIVLDMRIGQYPDGRTHDHGSAFRLKQRYFAELFSVRTELG